MADAAKSVEEEAAAVLAYWFDELDPSQHFAQDDAVDAEIAERFGALHARLAASVDPVWHATAETMLAAIVVLDQFSRNLFRDDARAYASDAVALALTNEAIERRFDVALTRAKRQFLYMPLMHSEVLADVERSGALMVASGNEEAAEFAGRHAEVIARFGRCPSRNAALGRVPTAKEEAFLKVNPSGF